MIADLKIPAADTARRHVEPSGMRADRVFGALLSVLLVDDLVDASAAVTEPPGVAEEVDAGSCRLIDAAEGREIRVERPDPRAVVDRARSALAGFSGGEGRLCGDVFPCRGVIRPEAGVA